MPDSRYQVIEGSSGARYYASFGAPIPDGDRLIAPKPGEDGLTWADIKSLLFPEPVPHANITVILGASNPVEAWE